MIRSIHNALLLVLCSAGSSALAHTIQIDANVWMCPATGYVHSKCLNKIEDYYPTPGTTFSFREFCKLTRDGSVTVKFRNNKVSGLTGPDEDTSVSLSATGLEKS